MSDSHNSNDYDYCQSVLTIIVSITLAIGIYKVPYLTCMIIAIGMCFAFYREEKIYQEKSHREELRALRYEIHREELHRQELKELREELREELKKEIKEFRETLLEYDRRINERYKKSFFK